MLDASKSNAPDTWYVRYGPETCRLITIAPDRDCRKAQIAATNTRSTAFPSGLSGGTLYGVTVDITSLVNTIINGKVWQDVGRLGRSYGGEGAGGGWRISRNKRERSTN